jgi:hypothetical protein
MKIDNLLVGGNSFTQHGIGGCPPTKTSPGGCSYVNQGQNYDIPLPKSWAANLAIELDVKSFVNMAASSHGNFLIAQTLWSVLHQFPYDPSNTLILFNVSISSRLDIPCEFNHPNASKFIPWGPELCPHSYLEKDSKVFKEFSKNIGLDIVPELGYTQIDLLFNYLENKNYQYFFLLTEKTDLENKNFLRIIEPRVDRLISLTPGPGLLEFSSLSGHNTENGYHPDEVGRKIISDQVREFLEEKKIIF